MGVTIVVPAYNTSAYLLPLAESVVRAGLVDQIAEILFVDDGSVDTTPQILEQLTKDSRFENKIRVLRLEPHRGRFYARFEGAKMAKGEWVLFLESRLQIREGFGLNLRRVLNRAATTVGWVDTDVTKNIYCLHWQRSQETFFRRHYGIVKPLELSILNYDRYLKGTEVIVCKTEHFLEVSARLEGVNILSDDTMLVRELLELGPVYIDPALKVEWEPRANLKDFLLRSFERGPRFVEFYVFKAPGAYAFAVMAALFAVAVWFGFALRHPREAIIVAVVLLPFIALTALPFGKTWGESLRLMPLHLGAVLFFGAGVLRGLAYYCLKSLKLRAPKHPL